MAVPSKKSTSPRPAMSDEEREKQLVAAAMNLAEEQILAGTASSQVLTHFLKVGSQIAKLESEKLELENKLLIAKTEQIESQRKSEEVYLKALEMMTIYRGGPTEVLDDSASA